MNPKTLLLTAALCGSITASAQTADEHVCKTDNVQATTEYSKAKDRTFTNQDNVYKYYCSFVSWEMELEAIENVGFVTTKSIGLLKQLDVKWTKNNVNNDVGNNPSTLELYAKNQPFTSVSDLYGSIGDPLTTFTFKSTQELTSSYTFENTRYIGLKPVVNNVHLESITLTWQLAHFRDNQTIGKLGTLCLPYNVSAEDMKGQIIPYTVAGKVTGSDGKVANIILQEAQSIEAGVPYVYIAKTQNVCLKYSQESSFTDNPKNSNGLYGALTSATVGELPAPQDDVFVIANNTFTLAGSDVSIPANRAYIRMSDVPECGSPSTARQLIIGPDGYELIGGSPTEALSSPRQQANKVIDYDINGRIISTTTAPRVILRKGRKVINPSAQIFR